MKNENEITKYTFKTFTSDLIYIEGFSEPVIKRDRIGQLKLTEMIWVSMDHCIQRTPIETNFILSGLENIAEKIENQISKPIKIVFQEIRRLSCDCQELGLFYAVQGWAAEHFGFEIEEINIQFDQNLSVHVFPEP